MTKEKSLPQKEEKGRKKRRKRERNRLSPKLKNPKSKIGETLSKQELLARALEDP